AGREALALILHKRLKCLLDRDRLPHRRILSRTPGPPADISVWPPTTGRLKTDTTQDLPHRYLAAGDTFGRTGPDLDTANRCAVVVRKGGARDVIVWQTGTARLLPRMLAGRRRGPVFLTDRAARPSVALVDVDPTTGKARLSYRRAGELFQANTTGMPGGPFTLHQLRHSALTHAAEAGASTPMLMALSGHTSVRSLAIYARVSAEALSKWQAQRDPAAHRNTLRSRPQ
ncbi:MAG: tyrosine-type recombinase/integrase, partial [Pseudonocardiaceae bacterium]